MSVPSRGSSLDDDQTSHHKYRSTPSKAAKLLGMLEPASDISHVSPSGSAKVCRQQERHSFVRWLVDGQMSCQVPTPGLFRSIRTTFVLTCV